MSKIQRSDFVARHGQSSVDLQKLESNGDARTQLREAGLGAETLRRADTNQDGHLGAGEAFKIADHLDRDGSRHSLIDIDAAGNATPAGEAVSTLGLLLQNRDLQSSETPGSATPTSTTASEPAPRSGPARLKALGEDLKQMPSQLRDGKLDLSPELLARAECDYGPAGRARLEAWQ